MALAFTNEGNSSSSTAFGTGAYTTPSFTPQANSLLVVFVSACGSGNGSIDIQPSMTIVDSLGSTWTKRQNVTFRGGGVGGSQSDSSDGGIQCWTMETGPSPAARTITVDCGAVNIHSYIVAKYSFTGYHTASPIGATATGTAVTTLSGLTLSGAPASSSYVIGAQRMDSSDYAFAAWTGFTEQNELYVQFQNLVVDTRTASTSTACTFGTTTNVDGAYGCFGVAIEVKAAIPSMAFPRRRPYRSFRRPF